MKLAINLPMLVSWQAFGEAFAICRHLGIDPVRLVDIFSDSAGGTNALKGRAAVVAQMLGGDDTAPGTYDLASCRKDLATMLAEAKTRGVELPLVERAFACFDEFEQGRLGHARQLEPGDLLDTPGHEIRGRLDVARYTATDG